MYTTNVGCILALEVLVFSPIWMVMIGKCWLLIFLPLAIHSLSARPSFDGLKQVARPIADRRFTTFGGCKRPFLPPSLPPHPRRGGQDVYLREAVVKWSFLTGEPQKGIV